jgi:proteasome component ECM29
VSNVIASQVQKICQLASASLAPFVPDLVSTLLEALSSLEPAALNYLSFHVEKYNITQEELEVFPSFIW